MIKYIHNVVQPSSLFISRTFSSSQTEVLCPLNYNSTITLHIPSPAPNNIYSTLCLYEFAYSRDLIQMESYNISQKLVSLFSKFINCYLLFETEEYS